MLCTAHEREAIVKQTYLALVSNVAAFLAVLLYWLYYLVRRCYETPQAPSRLWLRNLMYLWVTNVMGFSELVLLNPVVGRPVF